MSRVIRKPAFRICENKDADRLQLAVTAQLISAFVFRYTDSKIPLLPISEISSL